MAKCMFGMRRKMSQPSDLAHYKLPMTNQSDGDKRGFVDSAVMDADSRISESGVELAFDSVIEDSPLFRAALQRNEDELEELYGILESLVKSSRSSLEYAASTNDSDVIVLIDGKSWPSRWEDWLRVLLA